MGKVDWRGAPGVAGGAFPSCCIHGLGGEEGGEGRGKDSAARSERVGRRWAPLLTALPAGLGSQGAGAGGRCGARGGAAGARGGGAVRGAGPKRRGLARVARPAGLGKGYPSRPPPPRSPQLDHGDWQ